MTAVQYGHGTKTARRSRPLDPGQTCDDAAPTLRHFGQFSHAARENAMSRIYVGFHLRRAAENGLTHGREIDREVVWTQLVPTR